MKRASDVPKLGREVVKQAAFLSDPEARFLVSDYYTAQEMRKRGDMQVRHIGDGEEPALLRRVADGFAVIERSMIPAFEAYVRTKRYGEWMLAQHGIGPVLSAGFMANLTITHTDKNLMATYLAAGADEAEMLAADGDEDLSKAEAARAFIRACHQRAQVPTTTVGHWWSFAGLAPDKKWEKGKKRPWSADLKQLTFHAGECFKRSSGSPKSFYGALYRQRKELLEQRNAAGHYAERARTRYTTNSAEVRKLLEQGQLPAGNLDRQACNWAVKIFLSHLHALWFWDRYGEPPPKPFAIAHLQHGHEIAIPHSDMFPGFREAYYGGNRGQAAA